jgi:hypothetical protein
MQPDNLDCPTRGKTGAISACVTTHTFSRVLKNTAGAGHG